MIQVDDISGHADYDMYPAINLFAQITPWAEGNNDSILNSNKSIVVKLGQNFGMILKKKCFTVTLTLQIFY